MRDHSSGGPETHTQPSAPRASDSRSVAQARGTHVVFQHRHSGALGSGVRAAPHKLGCVSQWGAWAALQPPRKSPRREGPKPPQTRPRVRLTWQPCSLELSENQRERSKDTVPRHITTFGQMRVRRGVPRGYAGAEKFLSPSGSACHRAMNDSRACGLPHSSSHGSAAHGRVRHARLGDAVNDPLV